MIIFTLIPAVWQLFTAAMAALVLSATASAQPFNVFSKFGEKSIRGQRVLVHVTVAVPPGQDGNPAADRALERRGARPLQSAEYSFTGLTWDRFFDGNAGNDQVPQYYNPANQPTGAAPAFQTSQGTWTAVPTSAFAFSYAGTTTRCPSLVDECPGSQVFDGFNDVAWMPLAEANVLGVTWSGSSIDAPSTRVAPNSVRRCTSAASARCAASRALMCGMP